jgi:hypothetical protein
MLDERWGQIVERILKDFEVIQHEKDKADKEEIETIVFKGPMGKIKLVRTTRPLVLEKKIIGAHRKTQGQPQYEYIYSDTETTDNLEALREVDGEWREMSADNFM